MSLMKMYSNSRSSGGIINNNNNNNTSSCCSSSSVDISSVKNDMKKKITKINKVVVTGILA